VRTNFDIYVLVSKKSLFTSCIAKIYIKIFSYANYNFLCILLLMLGLLFTILKSELSSQSLILSVPDEGFSRNTLCALNLISTFLFVLVY